MNTSTKQNQNNPSPNRFISAYSQKLKVSITNSEPSRTKQSFKNECDINTIMSRYQNTGVLPDMLNTQNAQYLDVTGFDYQEAMQVVAGAKSLFEELPSKVRARFDNDPAQFLDFTNDANNRQEMAEMGLLKPEAVAAMAAAQAAKTNPPEALITAPIDKEPKTS